MHEKHKSGPSLASEPLSSSPLKLRQHQFRADALNQDRVHSLPLFYSSTLARPLLSRVALGYDEISPSIFDRVNPRVGSLIQHSSFRLQGRLHRCCSDTHHHPVSCILAGKGNALCARASWVHLATYVAPSRSVSGRSTAISPPPYLVPPGRATVSMSACAICCKHAYPLDGPTHHCRA